MIYSLGEKIKSKRTELNLSQESLSCSILSRSVLSKIENNKVTPSIYQLQYLSNVLNVSMEYFLDRSPLFHGDFKEETSVNNLLNLFNNKHYITIISLYEKKLINISNDIKALYIIGFSYFKSDYYNEAMTLFNKFIKQYFGLKDTEQLKLIDNIIKIFNSISFISCKYQKYNKSFTYYFKALNLLKKYNLTTTYMYQLTINNLGSLYNRTNKYNKCIKLLEEFLQSKPELINLKILANIHLALNTAYYNVGIYDKSIKHVKDAIFLFGYIEFTDLYKECYLNYINALRYSNNCNEALRVLNDFLIEHSENLSLELKIDFLMEEAILYFNINDYKKSVSLLSKLNINSLNSYNRNCYYFLKGHINFLNNKFKQAVSYLKKCESFFSTSNYVYDLHLLYKDLYYITNDKKYNITLSHLIKNHLSYRKNIVIPSTIK